jgi:hypothetical protein
MDASEWQGDADVIFTHPYAPIPQCLHGKPCVLNLYERTKERRFQAERWAGCDLTCIGRWGGYHVNRVYVGNTGVRDVYLADIDDIGIFFPEPMVVRVMAAYPDVFVPGVTVWDGFMGRGTVGKICRDKGMNFIGLDVDADMVRLAREYIGEI